MTATTGPPISQQRLLIIILWLLLAAGCLSAYGRGSVETEREWCDRWDSRTEGTWVWEGERCVVVDEFKEG